MEFYVTQDKVIKPLSRVFYEKRTVLALVVGLGIITMMTWRYWQNHKALDMMAASQSYNEVIDRLSAGHREDVAEAEKFIQANSNSYGVLAALQLVKFFLKNNEWAKAEQQLLQAKNQTTDDNLLSQINLSLARLQLQDKKWDHALKTLNEVTAEGWAAMLQDTRGDALLAKGDTKAAREFYTKGLESNPPQALETLLRIKVNNLSN
ncbi:UPF0070 protein YfgM [Serratia symbiotica]|nr:UPF0070 protein YfgM [Serratia symbiotica]